VARSNGLTNLRPKSAIAFGLRLDLPVDQVGHQLGQVFDQRLLELRSVRLGLLGRVNQAGEIFLPGPRGVERVDNMAELLYQAIEEREAKPARERHDHRAANGDGRRDEGVGDTVEQRLQASHGRGGAGRVELAEALEQPGKRPDNAQTRQHAWKVAREVVEQPTVHEDVTSEEHLGW
jgi:hypothetical protein